MIRATERAHLLLRQSIRVGDWVVDATVGNGHDTLFLAKLVGPSGRVFGFDVQQAALSEAARRVEGLSQVTFIHTGHEHLAEHIPIDGHNRLAAVMFNLGYLPGAPKDIITRTQTTLTALKQALDCLKIHGHITLILYSGHPGGAQEAETIRSHARHLPQNFAVTQYARTNSVRPAPEFLAIERLS